MTGVKSILIGDFMKVVAKVLASLMFVSTVGFSAAKIGFACVGGYLYSPDGSKSYVGSSDCDSANLGN